MEWPTFFEAPMRRDLCRVVGGAGEGEGHGRTLDHKPIRHARRRRELPERSQVQNEQEHGRTSSKYSPSVYHIKFDEFGARSSPKLVSQECRVVRE